MQEKKEEHFEGLVAQKAIFEHDRKILFVRPKSDKSKWDLPGGRLKYGEESRPSLQREVQEELGIDCVIYEVVNTNQVFHTSADKYAFFVTYKGEIDSSSDIKLEAKELIDYRWISPDEFTEGFSFPNVEAALTEYFNKKSQ